MSPGYILQAPGLDIITPLGSSIEPGPRDGSAYARPSVFLFKGDVMNDGIKQLLLNLGGRLLDYGVNRLSAPKQNPIEERIQHIDRLIQAIPADWEVAETPASAPESQKKGYETPPEGNPLSSGRNRHQLSAMRGRAF